MLRSILLSLTAESSYPILGGLGRPAQAWLLGQLTRSHASLASRLHDEEGLKPYTVSTLLDEHGRPLRAGSWLAPGQMCWLRITTLNEELSDALEKNIIRQLPKRLSIHKMDFRIDGFTFNPREHPWAGQTTFAEIAQDSKYVKVPRNLRMEFVSPTAFRANGNDIAIPAPQQIFRSLWQKWNALCPESMQVDDRWPDFAADCILVNELTAVNTTRWEFAEGTRGAATGFTGTVGFALLPISKVKDEWKPYWDGADVVMQSLARFAFYCGVGHHSTVGMGQARVIADRKADPILKRNPFAKRVR
jgi:CRISPR-associated endoribonuclease Cas6